MVVTAEGWFVVSAVAVNAEPGVGVEMPLAAQLAALERPVVGRPAPLVRPARWVRLAHREIRAAYQDHLVHPAVYRAVHLDRRGHLWCVCACV